MRQLMLAGIALTLSATGTASAQEAELGPLPGVVIPNIQIQPDFASTANGHKYFFFHRPDTTYAEAFEDLNFCMSYTVPTVQVRAPHYIPWAVPQSRKRLSPNPTPVTFGGALFGLIVGDPFERALYLTNMRRCMEAKDYDRYPMTKSDWEMVHNDKDGLALVREAMIASGAAPLYPKARK